MTTIRFLHTKTLTMNDIMEYTKNENFKYLVTRASHGNYYGFNLKVKKECTYATEAWQQRRCGGGAGVEQDWRQRRRHLGGSSGRVAGVTAVLAQQWQGRWRQRQWQHGSSSKGGRAVAAWRRQRSSGSMAVVAVQWQCSGGQRGSGVGQCGGRAAAGSMAVVSAVRWWWHWQHNGGGRLGGCGGNLAALQHQWWQQSSRSCAAAACCHSGDKDTGSNSNGRGTTNNQQSTKRGSSNGDGNANNKDK